MPPDMVSVVIKTAQTHPFLELVRSGIYETDRQYYATAFRGDYQFLTADRFIYTSKQYLYRVLMRLFPFLPLSEKNFYRKTVLLKEAKNRTDLCPVCFLHHKLDVRRKICVAQTKPPTPLEVEFEQLQPKHLQRAHHQREAMERDIKAVKQNECCMIVDFKENLRLPIARDTVQQDFFNQDPVTILTFVVYAGGTKVSSQPHVVTILSRCLTHTAAFVLCALRSVLSLPDYPSLQKLTWWSDGGPHFRTKQLIAAMAHTESFFGRAFNVSVNYLEPHHGKNACDGVFGHFAQLLQHLLPPAGIRCFSGLLSFFRSVTSSSLRLSASENRYTFLEFAEFLFSVFYVYCLLFFSYSQPGA
jgi:hypothetical protein